MHIDGDDLRDLTSNKDYSKKGRIKNIELAQKLHYFVLTKDSCNSVFSCAI